jgi:methylmalonyl-CoA mutase cobalamin-binding domain/chain
MVGGLIHEDDHATLRDMGVRGIFGPGSTIDAIADFVHQQSAPRAAQP